jgi:hypothetical protein
MHTGKPLLTDVYRENHESDKPISWMSEGKGNMVIEMKKISRRQRYNKQS